MGNIVNLHLKIKIYIMAKELKNLTKRSENYSKWYNELVVKADLAEQSDVRGCMIIKPYGYAIWEKIASSREPSKSSAVFLLRSISGKNL